jgi:hypothetical protein
MVHGRRLKYLDTRLPLWETKKAGATRKRPFGGNPFFMTPASPPTIFRGGLSSQGDWGISIGPSRRSRRETALTCRLSIRVPL